MKSPEKLLRFLQKKASDKGEFSRIARLIPKGKLREIRDRDPDELDRFLVEAAFDALELRSDDAPPIGVVTFFPDGHAKRYVIYGDHTVFSGVDRSAEKDMMLAPYELPAVEVPVPDETTD